MLMTGEQISMSQCRCDNPASYLPILFLPLILVIVLNSNDDHISSEEQIARDKSWERISIGFGNFINGYGVLMGTGIMALGSLLFWNTRNKTPAICCGLLAIMGMLYMNGFISSPYLDSFMQPIYTFPTDDQLVVIDATPKESSK